MRKRSILIFFGLIVTGLAPLLNNINNPRLAGMRAVDRIQLIATGACFGVAFVSLVSAVSKQKPEGDAEN